MLTSAHFQFYVLQDDLMKEDDFEMRPIIGIQTTY
jgi:hypothetical protein